MSQAGQDVRFLLEELARLRQGGGAVIVQPQLFHGPNESRAVVVSFLHLVDPGHAAARDKASDRETALQSCTNW